MMKGLLSAILLSEENNSAGKLLAEFRSAQCFVLIPPRPCLIWFCLCFLLFLFYFFFSNTEKLADRKLNVAEVTQSEIGQKQKLQTVLEAVHDLLRPHGWTIKWNVDCKGSIILSVSASQARRV